MIIRSLNLLKYLHSLNFPIDILAEQGPQVAITVPKCDFLALIENEAIIGIGSWNRIRHIRLNRPLETMINARLKAIYMPKAEDCKTTRMEGLTRSHHAARSSAYKRFEWQKQVSNRCV